MNLALLALAVGTFALGIAEFAMMGILGNVAEAFNISISEAGHFISAYSVGVAIGAPGLLLLRRWPLKRVMVLLSAIIAIGNAAAALSPNYITFLISRFVAGLPHGAFFGAGAIVCARLATKGGGASAVAIMVGGMTIANVVGVPCATLVSELMSWRLAFAIVALFGVLAYLGTRIYLPELEPSPDTGLKGQFRFLAKAQPWLIYAGVFFGQAGVYTYFSYIEPIMTDLSGFTGAAMTYIMMIAGVGMVVGNIVAGKLADRYSASLVTAWIAVLIVLVMPLIYLSVGHKLPMPILTFIATGCLFGLGGPLQYIIVRYAKGGEMLGGAGIQIAFNVSNAMAAYLGGLVISKGFGVASTALVGVPCAIIAAVALFTLHYKYKD